MEMRISPDLDSTPTAVVQPEVTEWQSLELEEERGGESRTTTRRGKNHAGHHFLLLVANYSALFIGSVCASLLSRFYFVHGGSSRWVATFVQSAGFPFLLLPIYLSPRQQTHPFSHLFIRPRLTVVSLLVGLFLAINNFLISWGISYLTVSTSSLLLSSELSFNLVLSFLLVNQKLKFGNLNCVVLLTFSSVLLALNSSSDRPDGVTRTQFFLGFFATLGAAGMFAIYLPIMEIIYRGVKTYRMVMEMQFVMQAVATFAAGAGMVMDGGFREMGREAKVEFDLGEVKYWVTVTATIVCWQLVFMGTAGMVFLTSSLHSGITSTAMLSMNVVAGVVVFGDEFGGIKAVSLLLCVWGFVSYLFVEYKRKEEEEEEEGKEMEMEVTVNGNGGERV